LLSLPLAMKATEDKINPGYGPQVEIFTNVDFTSIAANIINLNLLRFDAFITAIINASKFPVPSGLST
jgi:hypothetical protein